MGKYCLALILLCCFEVIHSQNFNYPDDYIMLAKESKKSDGPYAYSKLKQKFIDSGESFSTREVLALMSGYISSKDYAPYGDLDFERTILHAKNHPPDTVRKYSKEYIKINPISLSLNYGLWKFYKKENNDSLAKIFEQRFNLLSSTAISTGDGSSKKPYFITSPVDSEVLTALYLELPFGGQGSGINEEGVRLEQMFTADKNGNSVTLNFTLSHALGHFRD